MVATDDDVVVADAALQEVVERLLQTQVQLGAAHVGVGGALQQTCLADEVVFHARPAALDHGDIHRVEDALDGDAAERLVVVTHDVAVGHRGGDGAMGKYHLTGVVVQNLGRIGHKGHLACSGLHGQHGEQGLLVAFATSRDALLVEQCQGHAARGAGGGDEVKAVEREGVQVVALHDGLDSAVEAHGLDHLVARRLLDADGLADELVGDVLHLVVGDGLVALDHLVEGNVHHLDAPALAQGLIVHITGNEPSRRLADDAHALAVESGQSIMGAGIIVDALHDETGGTVKHTPMASVDAHPREDFERCSERVFQAVGNEHDIGRQTVDAGLDHFLDTSTAHEYHRGAVGKGLVQILGEDIPYVIFLGDGVEQFMVVGENRLAAGER